MNCQCESASVLGVGHTLLEEEMMVSEFQRSTALAWAVCCLHACCPYLHKVAVLYFDSFARCYRDRLLSLLFVGSQFQRSFSVTI